MVKKFIMKLVLLVSLITISCTSKQQAEEELIVDTEAVDKQLAEIDDSPSVDETNAGFSQDTLNSAEEGLGETAPSDASVAENSGTISNPETAKNEFFTASGVGNYSLAPADSQSNAAVDMAESKPGEMSSNEFSKPATVPTPLATAPEPEEPTASAPESKPLVPAVPLTKIEAAPFMRGGFLINAVYIARPGDTYKSISQKIYGVKSRANDLKAMNPGVNEINVGTKIYYNSPNRPDDEASLKFYYEDIGIQPKIFLSQKKENLRTKSKELLGFSQAWKEIWSTNPSLISKTSLPAGTEVYYWPEIKNITTPAPSLAATEPVNKESENIPEPAMPLDNLNPSDSVAMNDVPPPPPPAEALNPPPPPPPPPPPAEVVNPPPAFESPAQIAEGEEGSGDQDDMMMILGAIGILSAGAAGLIVIRKRKQQREAMAMTAMDSTHVGVVNK